MPPTRRDVSTDGLLCDELDRKPLSSIGSDIDAIASRVSQAIEQAARLLEPRVRTITLERSTLKDATEVETWLERQKATLMEAVADGPVLVN